jgi:hypothetical protein
MGPLPTSNFEQFSQFFSPENLLEGRFENDESNNPIYIGWTPFPNAPTSSAVFFIMKVEYTGNGVTWKRLPVLGIGWIYSWDDRADYFP